MRIAITVRQGWCPRVISFRARNLRNVLSRRSPDASHTHSRFAPRRFGPVLPGGASSFSGNAMGLVGDRYESGGQPWLMQVVESPALSGAGVRGRGAAP